ncbi:MAG: mechanosensitive ion channel family protein, partial [Armatimonadota bacterium]
HDLDTRLTTIRSLAKALAEIGDTCAENAALAAEGLVAIHQALAGSDQRGLLQPVSTRLSRETLVRAGHDLQQIPTGIAIALSPPAGGSWLDILPTRLGSVEEVGARALAAAILLAIAIAGWRAGPAKLRAYVGDETEGSADIVALLALIRAIALDRVGLAAIALLALTHAWSALLGTVLAWAALWVLWSGALGAALRFQAVGEGLEARALAHTFHWSGVLLLWSAVCGIVLRGLAAFGYSAGDVIYGLQLLYAVAACAVVLVLVGYHGGPLAALPATGHVLGRLRGAARQANAVAAVLAVALLGTLIAGYANLSVFFASRLALTVLVAAIAIWGHLRARALLSARLPIPAPDDASDEDDRLADRAWVRRAVLIGAAVVIIAIAAVLIGRIWGIRGWHVSQAIAFLSRPVISIGGTPISVVSVLQGMIVVALAMALGRWLRARLVRSAVLAMRYDAGVRHAIAKVTYYAVVVAGAALGFRVAGLELTAALAVSAGIVGIAVGFGSQHIASNFIAGIILTFDRSIDVGDYIEVGGQQGTILQISLRSTTIGTPDNRTVIIPNSSLIGQNVVGTTQRDRRVRLLVDVAVAGDSDPDKVASVLKETALHTDGIIAEPPPEAWITKLAAANLTFQLAAWTDDPQHQDRIRGILTTAVGKALKENEIKVA